MQCLQEENRSCWKQEVNHFQGCSNFFLNKKGVNPSGHGALKGLIEKRTKCISSKVKGVVRKLLSFFVYERGDVREVSAREGLVE